LDHTLNELPSTFDLNRNVMPVGQSVKHGVEAAIQKWKKNMQSAL
jgi:hypothetical protein